MKKKEIKISKNPAIKHIWFILGIISTVLGIAGYILPVMPGTTFIILALFCFARSNEKYYYKLLNNKYFGQTLKDFKAGKGMPAKTKIYAISLIVVSILISMYFASNFYVVIFLAFCGIFAIISVIYQKTKK